MKARNEDEVLTKAFRYRVLEDLKREIRRETWPAAVGATMAFIGFVQWLCS